ncbi:MAG TPA: DUF2652 domain-containing protein [Chloroflexia bacterium]|nr:DUF2652 domain-containing protein [Chloroflexia bacterium]
MTDRNRVQEGYLVLADVSGYTAFMTGSELEHAQAIMEELITLLLDHIRPPLKLVKFEGDAIFFYTPGSTFLDTTRLIDLLEVCYFAFADHLVNMQRATTCQCAACRAIPTLDLKMIAHYGSYLIQRLAGMEDLAGGDVILAHRLLKNEIAAQTGCPAYLFLTDACLARVGLATPLPRYSTSYDHLGVVAGGVYDLKAAWQTMTAARHVYITPAEADVTFTRELAAPPAVIWDYLVDPARNIYLQDDLVQMTNEPNADGRLGIGAGAHCAHGTYNAIHQYRDWRPFHYYTEWIEQTTTPPSPLGPPPMFLTFEFTLLAGDRTQVTMRGRLGDRESPLLQDLAAFQQIVDHRYEMILTRLEQMLVADGLGEGGDKRVP